MSYIKKYKEKFEAIKKLMGRTDPVIVEIGAHYGEDSLRFLECFPDVDLYCIEPDPRNIKTFKKYVNDPRVKLCGVAISNKNGNAELYQSHEQHFGPVPEKYDWISTEDYFKDDLNSSGASSLKAGYENVKGVVIVPTITYDRFVEDNNIDIVDLVWLDVQGGERDVLDGARSNLENIRYMIIEFGEMSYDGAMTLDETVVYLQNRNFTPFHVSDNDLWVRHDSVYSYS